MNTMKKEAGARRQESGDETLLAEACGLAGIGVRDVRFDRGAGRRDDWTARRRAIVARLLKKAGCRQVDIARLLGVSTRAVRVMWKRRW